MAWTLANALCLVLFAWTELEVIGQALYRNPCHRFGSFESSEKDWALVGHVINTLLQIEDALSCGRECLAHQSCLSYNYYASAHLCQINRSNKQNNPEDFRYRPGFHYYGSIKEEQTGPRCVINPCRAGGTCVDTCYGDMFTCHCPRLFTGKLCHRPAARSCKDLQRLGFNVSAKWPISPGGRGFKLVRCDQETDGGGWTVIQRRKAPFRVNFDRTWHEYRIGFGNPDEEFWLGNEAIHHLTWSGGVELMVSLRDRGLRTAVGRYRSFSISDANEKFRLCLGNWLSGEIGDAMNNGSGGQSGMRFSASDKDFDGSANSTCAVSSGWWFNNCGHSDLNGMGRPKWQTWSREIVYCEMKIRNF